jgi:hypothetical protein
VRQRVQGAIFDTVFCVVVNSSTFGVRHPVVRWKKLALCSFNRVRTGPAAINGERVWRVEMAHVSINRQRFFFSPHIFENENENEKNNLLDVLRRRACDFD